MIREEQMERAEKEFTSAAREALGPARAAERALEDYDYPRTSFGHDPTKRAGFVQAYTDADYVAESRGWIAQLIRNERKRIAPPPGEEERKGTT